MAVKPQRFLNLPPTVFLYTMDQVETMLSVERDHLRRISFFHGRTPGPHKPDEIPWRNINPEGQEPEWRCLDIDFVNWVRHKGYRIQIRNW